jgi:excisionase family DNA binding protein
MNKMFGMTGSRGTKRGHGNPWPQIFASRFACAIPLYIEGTFFLERASMDAIAHTPHRSTMEEAPIRVREAAIFLGVSPQTVYLWVERKQIPDLRVTGRNIRFLKSELEPFRAQFKQEIANCTTQ